METHEDVRFWKLLQGRLPVVLGSGTHHNICTQICLKYDSFYLRKCIDQLHLLNVFVLARRKSTTGARERPKLIQSHIGRILTIDAYSHLNSLKC